MIRVEPEKSEFAVQTLRRKNGSLFHTSPELFQAHKKTDLSEVDRSRISEIFVELYKKGLSLTDISRQTGKAKNTIRSQLMKTGIKLRDSTALPTNAALRESSKGRIRPYFGFCYFQGQIVPDPREFETLQLIHRLWKSGANSNRIADTLNTKKIPARSASTWNRNSLVNIISRFEQKLIVLKGAHYELR